MAWNFKNVQERLRCRAEINLALMLIAAETCDQFESLKGRPAQVARQTGATG